MSALGSAVAGALTGAAAIALFRRRNRPPRWLRPSTGPAEGHAAIRTALEAHESYPLRHRLQLDERGFNEVGDVVEHALERILEARDRSDARIERGMGEVYLDSEVVIAHLVRGRRES